MPRDYRKNGPAKAAPKPTEPVQLDPTRCVCPKGPTTIAHFVHERLVGVQRVHLRTDRCGYPTEHVDPAVYVADIRTPAPWGGQR